ncbi:MAG TPA: MraY family glycosyltransferase [Pyrinomonadaceae bacterium]|jgi:UDP-GlcNAc:undecaprenyl-phosphate GlcNAc-1-phosphate transferase
MNTYLMLFVLALFSSLLITPLLRRLCDRYGWVDHPHEPRRIHSRAIPRLGGVALYIATLLTLASISLLDNLVTQSLRAQWRNLFVLLLPATLLLLLGAYDDLHNTSPRIKLIAQTLAGILFYLMGGRIEGLTVPFVGHVGLPFVISLILTVVWIVGISNAFNLIDGMDGLATGAALFASIIMLVVSFNSGNTLVIVMTLVLSGTLIGFLRYNFNPASIFLGDSGSLFVGFMLAALSVLGMQKASTAVAVAIPLMAFALPVIDTAFTVVRRLLSGHPLFEGDREHIHHMLLARGWSQRRSVFVLYGVCALFGLMALLFKSDASGRGTALLLVVTGCAVVLALGRLRYHEVDEIKASLKRNFDLTSRRQRAIHNVRLRRSCRALGKAANLADLFNAVEEMLGCGEFVYAVAGIGRRTDALENTERVLRERAGHALRNVEMRDGLINWSWGHESVSSASTVEREHLWSLRLPLVTEKGDWGYLNLYRELDRGAPLLDISYLCTLFQMQLATAAERILIVKDKKELLARLELASTSFGD